MLGYTHLQSIFRRGGYLRRRNQGNAIDLQHLLRLNHLDS